MDLDEITFFQCPYYGGLFNIIQAVYLIRDIERNGSCRFFTRFSKMSQRKRGSAAKNDRPFHHMFQLPDIARESAFQQPVMNLGINCLNGFAECG